MTGAKASTTYWGVAGPQTEPCGRVAGDVVAEQEHTGVGGVAQHRERQLVGAVAAHGNPGQGPGKRLGQGRNAEHGSRKANEQDAFTISTA